MRTQASLHLSTCILLIYRSQEGNSKAKEAIAVSEKVLQELILDEVIIKLISNLYLVQMMHL